MFETSPGWKTMYPQAAIGVLALENVSNPASSAELDRQKEALKTELRERYGGYGRAELRALPSIAPYVAYYKCFKKSYHVLQQLESVAQKGKSIPRTDALVEAMFMASKHTSGSSTRRQRSLKNLSLKQPKPSPTLATQFRMGLSVFCWRLVLALYA